MKQIVPVNKIHGAIDGIDDPGRVVRELLNETGGAGGDVFFADELVVREGGQKARGQMLLDSGVGFGQHA